MSSHSQIINDEIIKQLALKILKDKLEIHRAVYAEFFLKYPGICTDYDSDCERKYNCCSQPTKLLAPCIKQPFKIYPIGTHEDKQFISTNVDFAHHIDALKIFGDYKTVYLKCPDGIRGCEVLHTTSTITFNEKQNELREQFNATELKYDDVLKLWLPFYDEKLDIMLKTKYNKFFAGPLTSKFISDVPKDLTEIEQDMSKAIDDLIHDELRYDYQYYEYSF